MNCPCCGSEDAESRRIDECSACGWGQTSPLETKPPSTAGCCDDMEKHLGYRKPETANCAHANIVKKQPIDLWYCPDCQTSFIQHPGTAKGDAVESKVKEISDTIWNNTSGWRITHGEIDDMLRELVDLARGGK